MALGDPVALVIAALTAAGVPASGRPLDPRPDSFATVRRIGGLAMNQALEYARLAVEVWAPTAPACVALANTARATLAALPETSTAVNACREALVFETPDPETGLPRTRVDVDVWLAIN